MPTSAKLFIMMFAMVMAEDTKSERGYMNALIINHEYLTCRYNTGHLSNTTKDQRIDGRFDITHHRAPS
jgi:hypothetical protein